MALFRKQEKPKRRKLTLLAWAAIGAAIAYFVDPDRGRARRARTRDQLAGAVRRSGRRAERLGRRVGADLYGVTQKVQHPRTEQKDYTDETLAEKVKTDLYRDPEIDRNKVLVNVENGVVVLRGEAQSPDQIKSLKRLVLGISGVEGVESLLRLPKTPAPNKAASRKAEAAPETGTG
jgi:hypothetical protein